MIRRHRTCSHRHTDSQRQPQTQSDTNTEPDTDTDAGTYIQTTTILHVHRQGKIDTLIQIYSKKRAASAL